MEVYDGLDFKMTNSAVSLGKFDGVHLGHRLLLHDILQYRQWIPTVFTFGAWQAGGVTSEQQIYVQKEKNSILEHLGIQREIIFPFHEETKNMTSMAFIREILVDKLDAKLICVGEDFRFGKGREGDVELLRRKAEEYGYELHVFPKLSKDGEVVSSTRIRKALLAGKLSHVNRLLGQEYFISGEVVHGNALGRTLNMPTANLIPSQGKLLPVFGVYATKVFVDGRAYSGVTNIGCKPTVGSEITTVETTLLDFQGDLYGKDMTVSFLDFIRPEKKFNGLEALKVQMEMDKEKARELLA